MTWHLKDRELEKKLTELCSDFLETLNYGVDLKREDENYILVSFDREKSGNYLEGNELWFWMDELEEVCEYNPKAWNDSRKVTPPEDVVFRAKVYRAGGETVLYKCLIFRRSVWYHVINGKPLGIQFSLYEGDYVEFRPWED